MQNFSMMQTAQSNPIWKLKAPTARIALDGSAELEEPEIFFYQKGRHASTAHAKTARVQHGAEEVRLEGDVIIEAHEDNVTLKTQTLDYKAQADRIRTEDDVYIERPGARVVGKGMEADSALNDITIFEQRTVIE